MRLIRRAPRTRALPVLGLSLHPPRALGVCDRLASRLHTDTPGPAGRLFLTVNLWGRFSPQKVKLPCEIQAERRTGSYFLCSARAGAQLWAGTRPPRMRWGCELSWRGVLQRPQQSTTGGWARPQGPPWFWNLKSKSQGWQGQAPSGCPRGAASRGSGHPGLMATLLRSPHVWV